MIQKTPYHHTFQQLVLLCILLSFFISVFSICVGAENWTTTQVSISKKTLNESPALAVSKETVHVVWCHQINETASTIYYRQSRDNGDTWESVVSLPINSTKAFIPAIAVAGSIVHIIWKDFRFTNPEIYYLRSTDSGITWEEPIRLTYNSSRGENIYDITITAEDARVYVVWKDYRTGSSEIFLKRSIDSGATWESDQRLTHDYMASYDPSLTVEDNTVCIMYEDYGNHSTAALLSSTDYGVTWTSRQLVSFTSSAFEYLKPELFLNQGTLYFVWQQEKTGSPQLYFSTSTDLGATWADPQQLTTADTIVTNPVLYVYNQELLLGYQQQYNTVLHLKLITSTDNGTTWNAPQDLLTDSDYYDLKLAGEAHNIHMICQRYHEAGWADILHLSARVAQPQLTAMDLSADTLQLPGSLTVTIQGFSTNYTAEELTCTITCTTPLAEIISLPAHYSNGSWVATLTFTTSSQPGYYQFHGYLRDPSDQTSDIITSEAFILAEEPAVPTTPGFTATLLFPSLLFVLLVLIMIKKHKMRDT
jgi:hypothetical protein